MLKLRSQWIAQLHHAPRTTPLIAHLLRTWVVESPKHLKAFFVGPEDKAFTSSGQSAGSEHAHASARSEAHVPSPAKYITQHLAPEAVAHETDPAKGKGVDVEALLRGCSIIVGLHPDEPTAAIVDCAASSNVESTCLHVRKALPRFAALLLCWLLGMPAHVGTPGKHAATPNGNVCASAPTAVSAAIWLVCLRCRWASHGQSCRAACFEHGTARAQPAVVTAPQARRGRVSAIVRRAMGVGRAKMADALRVGRL